MHEAQRIGEALSVIPARDRETWVRMGMAVKASLGEDGFDVWDQWSQRDETYNERDARAVWKSISPNGRVTGGTLFFEAQRYGYRPSDGEGESTAEEIEAERRARAERQAKADAEQTKRHAISAQKAAVIWDRAEPAAPDHPYLTRKGIGPHGARLDAKGRLVIPRRDRSGALHSLQFISGDGSKKYLTGGATKGHFYVVGAELLMTHTLCVAEGFATAASIHEATGYPVAVAFDAGNLRPVAQALHELFSNEPMIVCGDDDYRTTGNPGRMKAIEAAQSVGGLVAFPDFGAERPEGATDFNDMAAHLGLEAVKRAIETAIPSARAESQPGGKNAPAAEFDVSLIRASDITPEPVTWLWNGWLAAGKMHVLGGAPGTGKTTISMALAATISTGGRWPDGSQSVVGNVVIWSGEDDPKDTLVPRLALSGADLSRVYFIGDIREGDERRAFDPAHDMEPLRRRLHEIGDVRLLVVDPIVSAIAGDSHKNAEVRRALQPLADLAGSTRCAVLGITHFSKGTGGRDPVERLTGSLAFGALARVVLVAAKRQEEGEDGRVVRLFCRAKSNIGPDDGGYEYDLHQAELKDHPGLVASSVLWGEPLVGAARELLATADAISDADDGGTLADAKRFLTDLLADGPIPSKAIKADADGAGYSWATIRRAQKALGIEAVKDGMRGGWTWRLPAQEAAKMLKKSEVAQQREVSIFGKSEHLRGPSDTVEVEI